ncbi:MAG: hypothetical protein K6F63_09655 [Lachnospiraceae bacterium]|nr:hypothetical protein [Lachnospiraceae bacterium]
MKERFMNIVSDKGKRTAFDLVSGTVLYDLLALVIGAVVRLFFDFNCMAYAFGILAGMAVAVFMVIHMYTVLEKAVICDKKHARAKTKFGALLRMAVMVVVLIASALLPEFISMLGVIIGILALKIAALTQPLIDKFVSKFVKKEE